MALTRGRWAHEPQIPFPEVLEVPSIPGLGQHLLQEARTDSPFQEPTLGAPSSPPLGYVWVALNFLSLLACPLILTDPP